MANENHFSEKIHYDDNYIELSHIDNSFIMSLLEDSQVDDIRDDVRLRSVIQSLEAEILNEDSFLEAKSDEYCYEQLSDIEQMNSFCTSANHLDFEWMDQMDLGSYSDVHFEENMMELEGATRDFDSQICVGMDIEEANEIGLWHEE
ncbi:hypothetical protein CDL12_28822 [Handroanthus impetiginosus]|uniref:Uncharacterized protein n=1 Tax=Handroanthus impetiginosus TaxID=429701 RepID=A0A2G9G043_9LAMI|nr:hypothetical protein CDL12_28822 [Handroanthus impetiginosus]